MSTVTHRQRSSTLRRKSVHGAAMVEFAIILPVFLMLFLAIVAFSVGLYDKAVITNASREGARFGIVLGNPKKTATQISDFVTNNLCNSLITFASSSSCTVTVTGAQGAFGTPLSVTVSYPYSAILWSDSAWTATLTATTVMNNE